MNKPGSGQTFISLNHTKIIWDTWLIMNGYNSDREIE